MSMTGTKMTTHFRKRWLMYLFSMAFIVYVSVTALNIGYTTHAVHENNLKMCNLVRTSGIPLPTPPTGDPESDFGESQKAYNEASATRSRQVQAARMKLLRDFGCPQLP